MVSVRYNTSILDCRNANTLEEYINDYSFIGKHVQRGADWKSNDQDHYKGKPGYGTIIDVIDNFSRVAVKWNNGISFSYGLNELKIHGKLKYTCK